MALRKARNRETKEEFKIEYEEGSSVIIVPINGVPTGLTIEWFLNRNEWVDEPEMTDKQ